MMRTPFDFEQCYDCGLEIATCAQRTAAILPWASIKKAVAMPKFFAWLSQTAPASLQHSSD
jgi:hypothetical protein